MCCSYCAVRQWLDRKHHVYKKVIPCSLKQMHFVWFRRERMHVCALKTKTDPVTSKEHLFQPHMTDIIDTLSDRDLINHQHFKNKLVKNTWLICLWRSAMNNMPCWLNPVHAFSHCRSWFSAKSPADDLRKCSQVLNQSLY